jgi:uncharacterized protein YbaA (DUF1428 family)
LDYKECAGDDLDVKFGVPMPLDAKRMVYGGFKTIGRRKVE